MHCALKNHILYSLFIASFAGLPHTLLVVFPLNNDACHPFFRFFVVVGADYTFDSAVKSDAGTDSDSNPATVISFTCYYLIIFIITIEVIN